MTNRTNWDALRALKSAVGSLPPAENTDRAQVAALGSAGPAAGASVDLDQLAAEIVERAEAYSLDGFALKGRNELRAYVAGRLRPLVDMPAELRRSLAACQSLALTLGIEIDQLKAAVRAWATADTTHEGEEALYQRVLELAGVESATPAGPPVAPAGPGLDVERLVEALMVWTGIGFDAVDKDLRNAFVDGFDGTSGSAMRALVLAALGIEGNGGQK